MYPVSEEFQQAVQENTRQFYWTGSIRTKQGTTYDFGNEDIVKGSGYITCFCYSQMSYSYRICQSANCWV